MNFYIKKLQAAFSDLLGEMSIQELTTNQKLTTNAQTLESLLLNQLH